jgi:phage recombination protein Bet
MVIDRKYKAPSDDQIKQWAKLYNYTGEKDVVGLFHLLRAQMFQPNDDRRYHVPDNLVVLYLAYCSNKELEPLARSAHVVNHGGTWQVLPGVYELRTMAARTGKMGGKDADRFEGEIEVKNNNGGLKKVPESCTVTVYRIEHDIRCPYTYTAYFDESCATLKNGNLNSMWTKRSRSQLAKCAEAGALRIAFPEQLGGEMSYEEMDGQRSVQEAETSTAGAIAALAADQVAESKEEVTKQPETATNTRESASPEPADGMSEYSEALKDQLPWEVFDEPTDDLVLKLCSDADIATAFFDSLDRGVKGEGGSANLAEWTGKLKAGTKTALKSGLVAYRKSKAASK